MIYTTTQSFRLMILTRLWYTGINTPSYGAGIEMDEAIDIVSKTCAYTNHTILSEALEKWPIEYLKK